MPELFNLNKYLDFNNHYILNFNILSTILLLIIIKKVQNECTIEEPILLKNGSCVAQYCTEEQFQKEECIIANGTIKIQWLNNIIWVGDKNLRCINFATYSNGDMIIETSSTENQKRMFYGLKINGRKFFISNTSSNYFSMEAFNQTTNIGNGRNESEAFIVKINDLDNKEYLVSIGKWDEYTELYDFEENKIYQISTYELLGKKVDNLGKSLGYILDNNNVILFSYLAEEEEDYYYFNLCLLNFTSKNIENKNTILVKSYRKEDSFGETITCFITKLNYIICFYLSDYNHYYQPTIMVLDNELNFLNIFNLNKYVDSDYIFIKSIHLENEVGVFTFYYEESNKYIPLVLFRNYNNNSNTLENYFTLSRLSEIKLNELDSFNRNYLLNDMIKLSNHKICFITTSLNKEILYIITINIFGENKVIPRYYYIDIFILFKYKIFLDLRTSLYKNFISFGFSFCRNENCQNEQTDEHYSAFLIFSYANATDYQLNIENYLFNNNDIKIENIIIDLKDNVTIENNIFGYTFSGIKINNIANCDIINLLSINKSKPINIDYIFEEDEKCRIQFINSKYDSMKCTIEYVYIITEPDYDKRDLFPELKVLYVYEEETEEIYNSQKQLYTGRTTYYNIILENDLITDCEKKNCELCYKNDKGYCITCNSNYSIVENNKICLSEENVDSDINKESETDFINETEKNTEEISTELILCSFEQIIDNMCTDKILNSEQIKQVFNQIKEDLFNKLFLDENKIIKTKNVLFQISTLEFQKIGNISNISSIDFGECEDILKVKNNISDEESIKIIKIDIKSEDLSTTYVQYELFNPNLTKKLDLTECNNTQIIINSPTSLDNETIVLYNDLNTSGYNLFNYKDPFYNDICTTYTTLNKTDILLKDRQNDIFNKFGNKTFCQTNCEFKYFNTTNYKSICFCYAENKPIETNITKLNKIMNVFFETISNSNFLVLKCYKLVFNFNHFFQNIGRVLMTIGYIINLFILFIYSLKEKKKILFYLKSLLAKNFGYSPKKVKIREVNTIKNSPPKKVFNIRNLNPQINNTNNINIYINSARKHGLVHSGNDLLNMEENDIQNKLNEYKLDDNKPPNKIVGNNINYAVIKKNYRKSKKSKTMKKSKKKKQKKDTKNINVYKSKTIKITQEKKKKEKIEKINKPENELDKVNDTNLHTLNDFELNNLIYEKAIIYDKRKYCEYYCSVLKNGHIFLFIFLPSNDYNLISLKASMFLLFSSLYFTINGFFFNDKSMHKVYIDRGKFNFFYQIPQILYSCAISSVFNYFFKLLSLSEKNILSIKRENGKKLAIQKAKLVKKYLSVKFIIFFALGNIFLLFFWYYISCFCAVYINTQIILIEDTIICFILSMSYPFVIYLLPGLLRIPALNAKFKDKICLYKTSRFLSLI